MFALCWLMMSYAVTKLVPFTGDCQSQCAAQTLAFRRADRSKQQRSRRRRLSPHDSRRSRCRLVSLAPVQGPTTTAWMSAEHGPSLRPADAICHLQGFRRGLRRGPAHGALDACSCHLGQQDNRAPLASRARFLGVTKVRSSRRLAS